MRCTYCNKAFMPITKWQKFCSSNCKTVTRNSYRHPCKKCSKPIVRYAEHCHKCKPPSRIRDEKFFWSQVEKTDGCWVWKGKKYGNGYGRSTVNGKRGPAHRHAWELTNGPIPEGLYVCHHCDNKPCCRPDHLFAGTQKDNMQDWTNKGKNKLVSDPSYRKFMTKPKGRHMQEVASARLKNELLSGKRIILRDERTGRILGSRMQICAY